jgi:hypothetical protein
MTNKPFVHPDAPAGGGGPGFFRHPRKPGPIGRHNDTKEVVHVPEATADRMLAAATLSLPKLPRELRKQVAGMLTRETMAMIAASAAILAGSQAIGVGEIVDVIFLGIAVGTLGWQAIQAGKEFVSFWRIAENARSEKDLEQAADHFANAVTIVGVNSLFVLIARRSRATASVASVASKEQVLARWYTLIQRLELEPPPPNKGILWSKISRDSAEIMNAKKNGLVTLEMRLEDNGFLELYSKEFGSYEEAKAKGLDDVTGKIWQLVSKKYARLLEGKVTAYIDNKAVAGGIAEGYERALNAAVKKGVASSRTDAIHQGVGSDAGPVFTTELEEIAELMASNSKVTSVNVVDVKTDQTWHMTRQDILRITSQSAKRPH